MTTKASFWRSAIFHYGLSMLVFTAGLLLTLWLGKLSFDRQATAAQTRFRHFAGQAAATLHGRINEYVTLIRSSQALFAATQVVDARQWHEFVGGLQLRKNYPAIITVDYVAVVPDAGLAAFKSRMQQSDPDFVFRQLGGQNVHCIIQYEAPPREPSPAIGFDTCNTSISDGAVRTVSAYRQAAASGRITLSGKIELNTREPPNHIAVLLMGPVYQRGAGPSAGGHGALLGWTTIVVSVRRVLAGLTPATAGIKLVLRDGPATGPLLMTVASGDSGDDRCATPFPSSGCLAQTLPMEIAGRHWTLTFSRSEGPGHWPWETLVSGFLISLLLALALFLWGRTRIRAFRLATRMTGALRESENLLTSITDNIFEGIYRNVPGKGLAYLNKSLVTMFGYTSVEEMRAAPGPILYANPRQRDELRVLLEKNGYYRGEEVEYVRRDGSHFFGVNNAVAVYDEQGGIACVDGAISDVTARKAAEERVRYLARFDSLTGLENRATFRKKVRQEIDRAIHDDTRLAILFLDLDRFKIVNDFLGHNVGDQLLKAVSKRIRNALREHDAASRQGGDEFLVLLTDIDSEESAVIAAQRLLHAVAGGYTVDTHEIAITPSIGISIYPEHGDTVEALIKSADAAMYHAKASGRHNFQVFTPELHAERSKRAELERDLRQALRHDEFGLYYQPQIELETGRIVSVEALLRWHHPGGGTIPPNIFIPVAEQSGLIVPIGEWVLREACRQNREWQLAGLPIVPVAVNISAVQFHHRAIHQNILDALRDTGLAAKYLELELTETAVMEDISRTATILDELRKAGIQFAIDDFGTGYSSLSYLRWFKIAKLKIDQSFVRDIDVGDNAAIVKAIIGLAKNFRLQVVAEGIETVNQLEFMRAHQCDNVQGYYFSRPVPPDEFARLLTNAPHSTTAPGGALK